VVLPRGARRAACVVLMPSDAFDRVIDLLARDMCYDKECGEYVRAEVRCVGRARRLATKLAKAVESSTQEEG